MAVAGGETRSAGGAAAFGIAEAGQIVSMGQTECQPSLQPAHVKRDFATPKPLLTPEQVPRFIMVCA